MTKVLVAGSQKLFRQGLKCILTKQFGGEVEIHESSDQFSVTICRDLRPDIVVLDVDIPIGSGIELESRLVTSECSPKVVVITSKIEPALLNLLIETGAAAYLTKNCPEHDFVEAITSVINGRAYISEQFSRLVTMGKLEKSGSISLGELSRREMEVMLFLAEGRSSDEIATYLSISPKTVASYKQRIHDKLKTRNTAEITRVAIQLGLLTST